MRSALRFSRVSKPSRHRMDSDRGDGGGKLGGAGVKSRDGHRSLEFFGVAAPNAEGPDEGKGRGVPEGR